MKNIHIKGILIWLVIIPFVWSHPFHVSITTFQLNRKSHTIEITMKLFTEDLENVIESKRLPPIKLGSKREYIKTDSLIFDYLSEHLIVSLDNKQVTFQWVGKEIENDITWCYLEIKNMDDFWTANILNTIFIPNFTDQLNISHFQKDGQIQTVMNHKTEVFKKIQFQKKDK
ncbi:MAG: hypothetical protein HOK07_05055 [Candidatus Marinimicrobia bacterium]|nr:hypothetical protein [Candidatus Neomarinimicrobiota bacterium]